MVGVIIMFCFSVLGFLCCRDTSLCGGLVPGSKPPFSSTVTSLLVDTGESEGQKFKKTFGLGKGKFTQWRGKKTPTKQERKSEG